MLVSQLLQGWLAISKVGLFTPRTVVSTRVVYSVLHFGHAMPGASGAATAATGAFRTSNCAPFSWAKEFEGVQTASATASDIPATMEDSRINVFIFCLFIF